MVLDRGDYFEGNDLREVMRQLFDSVHDLASERSIHLLANSLNF